MKSNGGECMEGTTWALSLPWRRRSYVDEEDEVGKQMFAPCAEDVAAWVVGRSERTVHSDCMMMEIVEKPLRRHDRGTDRQGMIAKPGSSHRNRQYCSTTQSMARDHHTAAM